MLPLIFQPAEYGGPANGLLLVLFAPFPLAVIVFGLGVRVVRLASKAV